MRLSLIHKIFNIIEVINLPIIQFQLANSEKIGLFLILQISQTGLPSVKTDIIITSNRPTELIRSIKSSPGIICSIKPMGFDIIKGVWSKISFFKYHRHHLVSKKVFYFHV